MCYTKGGSADPPFLISERTLDLKPEYITGAVVILGFAIVAVACGTPSTADTLLISIDGSTISVAEAGCAWVDLSPEQQEYFIQRGDQVNDFTLSLARKDMIIREIQRLNYLQRSDIVALGNAHIRMEASLHVRDSIFADAEESVTAEDIEFFKDHMGRTVWYTFSPGSSIEENYGPSHLPELPRELAVHLDSMNVGDELSLSDGTLIRFDSVVVTDPELVAESLVDSDRVTALAVQRFSSARGKADIDRIAESLLSAADPCINTEAVDNLLLYYSGLQELVPGDSVIISSREIMTAMDIVQEIEYQSGFYPVKPSDPDWLEWFIDNTLLNDALRQYYEAVYPEEYAELLTEADEWILGIASDRLFEDEVYSFINVTPQLLQDEFNSLTETPIIPETRSIQSVRVVSDNVEAYETAVAEGNSIDPIISRCDFWTFLSEDDPPSNITRPLLREEIPGNRGDEVFALQPEDTLSWSSLSVLYEGYMYMAFRLVSIHAPHEAIYEELEPDLYQIVRARLMAERTGVWLEELGEEYSLTINEDILSTLPSNPALWPTCE